MIRESSEQLHDCTHTLQATIVVLCHSSFLDIKSEDVWNSNVAALRVETNGAVAWFKVRSTLRIETNGAVAWFKVRSTLRIETNGAVAWFKVRSVLYSRSTTPKGRFSLYCRMI